MGPLRMRRTDCRSDTCQAQYDLANVGVAECATREYVTVLDLGDAARI